MKLGLSTPVVTLVGGLHAEWERSGTIEDVARIAEEADRLGYDHLSRSEHIGVPASETPRRGARDWDPLATFGYLAARTQRIRLATWVLVLGYHHPLEIVKRYGTLDQVSGGRLLLGVGVGSLQQEFDLLGASFEDRADRPIDAIDKPAETAAVLAETAEAGVTVFTARFVHQSGSHHLEQLVALAELHGPSRTGA